MKLKYKTIPRESSNSTCSNKFEFTSEAVDFLLIGTDILAVLDLMPIEIPKNDNNKESG